MTNSSQVNDPQVDSIEQILSFIPDGFQFTWQSDSRIREVMCNEADLLEGVLAIEDVKNARKVLHRKIRYGIEVSLLDACSVENHNAFKLLISTALAQGFYITSHAASSLEPALSKFPSLKANLLDFIESEKGHEFYYLEAAKELDSSLDSLKLNDLVIPEIKSMMSVLKYAASNNGFALIALIELFEEEPSDSKQGFWHRLYANSDYRNVAKFVIKHKELNSHLSHNNIYQDLAKRIGLISKMDFELALFLVELVEKLRSDANKRLLSIIQ